MKIGKYLKERQNTVYQTFFNAINTSRLSHAYLLVGEQGTPLLESAIFLAKTLVCDNPNPLACEECLTCLRIDEGNYADLIIVDGTQKSIKKDDVHAIEERFETSAVENKGKMIYIINHVENMTNEAINSLLKFLEEPSENIFAFLTCENESRVLPTIVSRSQTLHFKSVDKKIVKNTALELGVEETDAELLCNFYNNAELIKEKLEDTDYLNAKNCLEKTIKALNKSVNLATIDIHQEVLPKLKSKESMRYFLDMLTIVFQDLLNLTIENDIILKSYMDNFIVLKDKLPHIQESLLTIMTTRGQIDMNINLGLLLDHVINFIVEGDEKNGK
ncbi:MAG: DNA polymerase III subunit delta [Erysipelotrichales bacterium]|nr:DNA polymerase III subunit delta [Erysipelotrichales bacterium]